MTHSADLLIIGGGIVGLTSALSAADAGCRVLVCDEPRTGSASRAAAGMLAPSLDGMPDSVQEQAFGARDFYQEFLSALHARSDVRVPLNRLGIIEVAHTERELATLFAHAPSWAERLDQRELARAEPALAAQHGALFHKLDGAVDNVTLMHALDVAVSRTPAIVRKPEMVTSINLHGFRPRATTVSGTTVDAGMVLLAAGAWANGLDGLPRTLPVRPLAGQLLLVDRKPVEHVVYAGGGYLVPRGTALLIGATTSDTGFENDTTVEGLLALRTIASRAIPGLGDAAVLDHWSGLRPVTPDGLPILGPDPDFPALLYACGFSRNGILLAPWAAKQMTPLLLGKEAPLALSPFGISRFYSS